MAKERTTISLDFSNLCEEALKEFLGARGALPADMALKVELVATAEQIGLPAALEQLRKKLRQTAA
jgi:hypothetical protein